MTLEEFFQYLIFGVQDGSIFALIGLGFTIIYSVTNIINFAQGEFVMLGGMLSYMLTKSVDIPTPPTIVISLLVAAAIGIYIYHMRSRRLNALLTGTLIVIILGSIPLTLLISEKLYSTQFNVPLASILSIILVGIVGGILYILAIRSAIKPSPVSLIIITIGAALFIRGIAGEMWGIRPQYTPVYWNRDSLELMGSFIHTQTIWIFTAVVLITFLLQVFFAHTMLGKSLKACAVNPAGAGLMGINPKTMALIAFILAAVIGAVIGTIMTPKTGMDYNRGFVLGLYGFVAASLGGFRSHLGAVIGGLLLGQGASGSVSAMASNTWMPAIPSVMQW